MYNNVLEVWNISKAFRGNKALDKLNMSVPRGCIYGLIGQNGSGKTTLLRIIAGLIFPSEGEIALFGHSEDRELAAARRRMGCVVESPVFFPKLSVKENLEYYRIQRGIPDKKSAKRIIETMRLSDVEGKSFQQLPLSTRQRLGLALASMGTPDFLILDEPVSGMDQIAIAELRAILLNLNKSREMTILITSPVLTELAQISTEYGILHQGSMVKQLSREQLEKETRRGISIKVDDVAATAAVLEEKFQTVVYEVLPGDELRVYGIEDPSEMVFQFSDRKIRIRSVIETGLSLEDFIIQAVDTSRKGNAL